MSSHRKDDLAPSGADVDLEAEEVYLEGGHRLTDELAAEIAEEAIAGHYRAPGRPSITGPRQHTPKVTLRIREETRHALEEIASKQGRRLADVGREAFEEYISRHADEAS